MRVQAGVASDILERDLRAASLVDELDSGSEYSAANRIQLGTLVRLRRR
jgi:hypothetical protein